MNLILSIMQNSPKIIKLKKLFCIINTDDPYSISRIKFPQELEKYSPIHGMGMTYVGDLFCAGIIPFRERLTSLLLTINLSTGNKNINKLFLTKAVHGIFGLDNYRLLANSTQTDQLVEVVLLEKDEIEFVDIVFNFNKIKIKNILEPKDIIGYRAIEKFDDKFHINSVCVHDKKIYFTQFRDFNYESSGMISYIDDSGYYPIKTNLNHPHSVYADSKGNILLCDSANFKVINLTAGWEVECEGYTRGICEDKGKGGYWVGASSYRKFSKTENKWVRFYREDIPRFKFAQLHFITYDGILKETILLDAFKVKEIFEIIEKKDGDWGKLT
jgi:hypothetical protein